METQGITGSELASEMKINICDSRDDGVAARGGVIDTEDDWLAVGGDLDCAPGHWFAFENA